MAEYEYIANNQYARTNGGHEYYPKPKDIGGLFTKNSKGDQVYAIQKDVQVYPKFEGRPVFAKSANGTEVYAERNSVEVYPVTDDEQYLFAKNAEGEQRYARDHDLKTEFYPQKTGGKWVFIQDEIRGHPHRRQRYATNGQGVGIYPQSTNKDELYLQNEFGDSYYATDGKGNEIPAKRTTGEEYVRESINVKTNEIEPVYPRTKDGNPFYPKTESGESNYPKDDRNNELYLLLDAQQKNVIFTHAADGSEKYARIGGKVEYYPITGQFAKDSNKRPKYALNLEKNVGYATYPKENRFTGEEMYISHKGADILPPNASHYVKRNGREIYPRVEYESKLVDKVLTDQYAKDVDDEFYYPTDHYGNEYVDDDIGFIKEDDDGGYPITNDNYIIVPQRTNGSARFVQNGSIEKSHVKHALWRPHLNTYRDYRTNRKSSRTSRHTSKPYHYTSLSFGPFHFLLFVLIFLAFITVCLLLKRQFYKAREFESN